MARFTGEVLFPQVKLGKDPADCWTWLGGKTSGGYGKKTYGGRTVSAHRWMWVQLFGAIPDGLVIDHLCSNRECVNPHHLQVVTQAVNMQRGINATLTPLDVLEIRKAKKTRTLHTAAHLAEKFNVRPDAIRCIWGGKTWGKGEPFYGARTNAPSEQEIAG